MKIVLISDQHGLLPEVPECDLLCIAGDICPVSLPHDPATQAGWLDTNFRRWLEEVPADRVVGIAGNHDFVFEAKEHPRDMRWTYLIDSGMEYEGVKVWGTPWVPNLPRWAFSLERIERNPFAAIPEGIDILLSHGPPYGRGDFVPPGRYSREGEHVGAKSLLTTIKDKQPRLLVCGHIHEDRGRWRYSNTTIRNVALVDDNYERGARDPVVLTF
jgi:Icc-related predicted phosphoesterase